MKVNIGEIESSRNGTKDISTIKIPGNAKLLYVESNGEAPDADDILEDQGVLSSEGTLLYHRFNEPADPDLHVGGTNIDTLSYRIPTIIAKASAGMDTRTLPPSTVAATKENNPKNERRGTRI